MKYDNEVVPLSQYGLYLWDLPDDERDRLLVRNRQREAEHKERLRKSSVRSTFLLGIFAALNFIFFGLNLYVGQPLVATFSLSATCFCSWVALKME